MCARYLSDWQHPVLTIKSGTVLDFGRQTSNNKISIISIWELLRDRHSKMRFQRDCELLKMHDTGKQD